MKYKPIYLYHWCLQDVMPRESDADPIISATQPTQQQRSAIRCGFPFLKKFAAASRLSASPSKPLPVIPCTLTAPHPFPTATQLHAPTPPAPSPPSPIRPQLVPDRRRRQPPNPSVSGAVPRPQAHSALRLR